MPKPRTDTSHLRDLLGHVNSHSTVAVFRQIETKVRYGISAGTLKAGDQLPTVRELTEWLDTTDNTGAKAYRDLEVMGLVYTRRGWGVFVSQGVQDECREKVTAEIIARVFEVCSEAKAAGMTAAEIKAVAKACYKTAGAPYGEVPKEIMALAKRRK